MNKNINIDDNGKTEKIFKELKMILDKYNCDLADLQRAIALLMTKNYRIALEYNGVDEYTANETVSDLVNDAMDLSEKILEIAIGARDCETVGEIMTLISVASSMAIDSMILINAEQDDSILN